MFCTKCGKQLNDDAKFCTNCGTKTEAEQPAAQPAQPEAPPAASVSLVYQPPKQASPPPAAQQPVQYNYAPPKKSNTGLIIGISIAAVLVFAVAGFFLFKSFFKNIINSNITASTNRSAVTAAPSQSGQTAASKVAEAWMASTVDSFTYEPKTKISTFAGTTPQIYCCVRVSGIKQSTKVSAKWIYLSTNESVVSDVTATYDGWIGFTLTGGSLPAGSYRVDISVNDVFDRSVTFTVT